MQYAMFIPSPLVGEGWEGGSTMITPLPAHFVRRPPPQGGRQQKKTWRWLGAAFLIALAGTTTTARAETYPSKIITIIAPASPGGVTDLLARMLARRFIADWGAQAIVENKPGANNQVAAEYVARQPADGYTLFIGPETTFIVNPALYAHERFHADRRARQHQSRAGAQSVGAGRKREGLDRARQGEAGPIELRRLRRRLAGI